MRQIQPSRLLHGVQTPHTRFLPSVLQRLKVLLGAIEPKGFTRRGRTGGCGEEDVGRRIERGLHRVLHHADHEADRHHLHRHVGINAEQRARHPE